MKYADFFANVEEIETLLGYVFHDKSLLAQAFTRTSFCNEHNLSDPVQHQSNEVLEFLGDSVLSLVVATMLTEENSQKYKYGIKTAFKEGDFSNIKSKLSDKTNLSASIKKLGIQKHLLMGEGDVKLGIQNEPSVMEDLFESVVGAVYIDSEKNLETIKSVITNILDVSIYLKGETKGTEGSAKNLLQEWCAEKSRRLPVPEYSVSVSGPEHSPTYIAECRIGEHIWGIGSGKNKKSAESSAAKEALIALKKSFPEAESAESYTSLLARLSSYRKKTKAPQPDFKELGETEFSTKTRPEFIAECTLGTCTKIGTGASKKEAKRLALFLVLEELSPKAQS